MSACVLVASLFGVFSALADDDAIRIEYHAPEGCPDASVFLEQVKRRTLRARFARPGEIARKFVVTIENRDSKSVARIEFTDPDSRKVMREVAAASCGEVIPGIALVTALAIEARAGQRASEPESRPRVRAPAPAPDRKQPPRGEALQAPGRTPTSEPPARWDVGVGLTGGAGFAPGPILGLEGFVEFSPDGNRAVRVSGGFSETRTLTVDGGRVHFDFAGGRAELCPFRVPMKHWLALVPCAGLELGRLQGEGEESAPRIIRPDKAAVFWRAALLAARLQLDFNDFLVFEGRLDLRFPLFRHEFVLDSPRKDVYTLPVLAAGGALSVGFRFE